MDFVSFSSTAESINLTILQIFFFKKIVTASYSEMDKSIKACTDYRLN
jgi:hypothetical protein